MDIERTIQFIVEQQARFSADIDVLKEALSQQGENISRLNVAIDEVVQSQKKTSEYLAQLTGVVASLADSVGTVEADQRVTSQNLIRLTDVVAGLADSASTVEAGQRETSQDLIKLADVVARLADSTIDIEAKPAIMGAQAELDRAEIRDAIGKLVSSEEETRRFAIEIAHLVKQHEARIVQLENK